MVVSAIQISIAVQEDFSVAENIMKIENFAIRISAIVIVMIFQIKVVAIFGMGGVVTFGGIATMLLSAGFSNEIF